jgi:chaperone required for assembly of F1-ATPase
MKRFWDTASVVQEGGSFSIRLDGRPMRLPGTEPLALGSAALAEAIGCEWQEAGGLKGGDFAADDLPLTRLAATAQQRISPDPHPTIDALAKYAENDLLCYHAAFPEDLVALQEARWRPLLAQAVQSYGAELRVMFGVMPQPQPPEAVASLRRVLAACTADELAGLGSLVPATGSLVLGLFLAEGRLDAKEVTELAFLDHDYQAEKWGLDADAVARRAAVASEIAQATRYIRLTKTRSKTLLF